MMRLCKSSGTVLKVNYLRRFHWNVFATRIFIFPSKCKWAAELSSRYSSSRYIVVVSSGI
jgi:hypothetical protein